MRRLILFRHAKALSPEGLADRERPLDPIGVRAVPVMARWLADQGFIPDLALVSPALRTMETWALAAPAFDRTIKAHSEAALYDARVTTILSLVRSVGAEVASLVVVGHNPGLEELAGQLSGLSEASARRRLATGFPPGAIAVLNCPDGKWSDLQPGGAELTHIVTPADLGAR
ncbi:phosphoglycerate mutase [Agaricicola taiwanensis]|uniref:Phosphoglycerate mutase n=1 Tax=Agaricicola taiwanensis TaxID=591372 RepID=A0A8J2YHI1_9RHOB|nr:histidine phosphatase family protein [Agaricicola taiwanensis]GGE43096.1 phosphoglycerate mutase [Agaricicola taiwanensis]